MRVVVNRNGAEIEDLDMAFDVLLAARNNRGTVRRLIGKFDAE